MKGEVLRAVFFGPSGPGCEVFFSTATFPAPVFQLEGQARLGKWIAVSLGFRPISNSILRMASKLPIYDIEDALVSALRAQPECPRLVLEAPTGSGKSTQIPQMLLDRGLLDSGEIVVLQPRRVAARMLARRVAQERGGRVGDEVGYQVRFENHVGPETRIRYVTEGVLLRQILTDPTLSGVSAILFDEFHERHFFGDITLARAVRIQRESRPDLAILVTSATLDGERIQEFLEDCPRLSSEGRTFPVEVRYAPIRERQKGELWDHIVRTYLAQTKNQSDPGDCLVFLPGAFEIRKTVDTFRRNVRNVDVLPLYGELNPRDQDRAIQPGTRPKIVVATNVAETSLTIDGVTLVIDSGLARIANYDVRRGINTLTIEKISQASADQRAGRAGRTAPGTCLRLWSPEDQAKRPGQTPPEIHRMDLAEVILTLLVSGIDDLETFEWFEKPDEAGLERAFRLLIDLGALKNDRSLTRLGRDLARFPVTPRYARVLLEGARLGCFGITADMVALTQGKPLFPRRGSGREEFTQPDDGSDFQPALRALATARDFGFDVGRCESIGVQANAAREVDRLAKLLRRSYRKSEADGTAAPSPGAPFYALLAGFPDQIAKRLNRSNRACAVTGNRRGQLSDESCVTNADLLIVTEITEIEGRELNVLLNLNTAITRELLEERFPEAIQAGQSAEWNPRERRVDAREVVRYRDLDLESKPAKDPPEALAAEILAREVVAGNLVLKKWDRKVEQWIARLSTLANAMPELELPTFSEEDKLSVIEQICLGAFSYKQIKEREVWPELRQFLAPHQIPLLDQLVPDRIELANGRSARIRYEIGAKPVLSARLQHLYDIPETPSLAQGRIPLRIEILAPNQRPVQITEDLPGFWENSYAAVKNELKGRYPKHEWR